MYKVDVDKASVTVATKEGKFIVDGQPIQWDCIKMPHHNFHILHQNKSYLVRIEKADYTNKLFSIKVNGFAHEVKIYSRVDLIAGKMQAGVKKIDKKIVVKAPMPGLILDIKIKPGDKVKAGDPLLVLEAMKMENTLKATYDGSVKNIRVSPGESVEKDQILIEF